MTPSLEFVQLPGKPPLSSQSLRANLASPLPPTRVNTKEAEPKLPARAGAHAPTHPRVLQQPPVSLLTKEV